MTITVSTSDPRSLKALAILETADRWTRGHRKDDGRPFFVIPGSAGRVYWTDARSCTCPDATGRGATCKHQLAVRLWIARRVEAVTRRAARRHDPAEVAAASARYEELFGGEA